METYKNIRTGLRGGLGVTLSYVSSGLPTWAAKQDYLDDVSTQWLASLTGGSLIKLAGYWSMQTWTEMQAPPMNGIRYAKRGGGTVDINAAELAVIYQGQGNRGLGEALLRYGVTPNTFINSVVPPDSQVWANIAVAKPTSALTYTKVPLAEGSPTGYQIQTTTGGGATGAGMSASVSIVPQTLKVGDSWTVTLVSSVPNSPVHVDGYQNGNMILNRILQGNTDASGRLSFSGVARVQDVGTWREVYYVGDQYTELNFSIGQAASAGAGAAATTSASQQAGVVTPSDTTGTPTAGGVATGSDVQSLIQSKINIAGMEVPVLWLGVAALVLVFMMREK